MLLSIKESLVKLDLVANLVNTYVEVSDIKLNVLININRINCSMQCYEFDKFEGYATEEEAVERGMGLIDTGGLWAVIVFKAQNNNLTSQDLPHNITYKLRYFSRILFFAYTWFHFPSLDTAWTVLKSIAQRDCEISSKLRCPGQIP